MEDEITAHEATLMDVNKRYANLELDFLSGLAVHIALATGVIFRHPLRLLL